MNALFSHRREQLQSLAFALRWPLITLTVLIAFALAGTFVTYDFVVSHGHPWLPPKTCMGCALCGMTRAFCAMSASRWSEAADWNPLGPAAYCVFWSWLAIAIFIATQGMIKSLQQRDFAPTFLQRRPRKSLQSTPTTNSL
jgi:hypothetical protein